MSNYNNNTASEAKADFLGMDEVKVGLNIKYVKELVGSVKGAQSEAFKQAMYLGQEIYGGIQWYNSADGKLQREVSGIEWNVAEMGREVYGLGKTQLYNYNKAYKATLDNDTILADYKEFVRNEQQAGEDVELTLKGFLNYVKEENAPVEDEDKSEVEASFKFGSIGAKFYDDGRVELGKNSIFDVENALLHMLEEVRKVNHESGHEELTK